MSFHGAMAQRNNQVSNYEEPWSPGDYCTSLCLLFQSEKSRGAKEGQGVARAHMRSGRDSRTEVEKKKMDLLCQEVFLALY